MGWRVQKVDETWLRSLVEAAAIEDRNLEFKKEIPSKQDSEKNPFLHAIAAFANGDGGYLILGLAAEKGVAKDIAGLDGSVDDACLRVDQMIATGIEPRVTWNTHKVLVSNGRFVLVIEVQKNWTGPHMTKSDQKFYVRSSSGKIQMDYRQIRDAFSLSENAYEKIRGVHDRSVAQLANATAQTRDITKPAKAFANLHVMPLTTDPTRSVFGVEEIAQAHREGGLDLADPLFEKTTIARPNARGYVTRGLSGMTQIYRSGVIECAAEIEMTLNKDRILPNGFFEEAVVRAVRNYSKLLDRLSAPFPHVVFMSLVNMDGWMLWHKRLRTQAADMGLLQLPEVLIPSPEASIPTILRPLFDGLWNSFGQSSCLYYDAEGQFDTKRLGDF